MSLDQETSDSMFIFRRPPPILRLATFSNLIDILYTQPTPPTKVIQMNWRAINKLVSALARNQTSTFFDKLSARLPPRDRKDCITFWLCKFEHVHPSVGPSELYIIRPLCYRYVHLL
ncbi:hypothetical protein AAEP93_003126 [Penicillium crustosum]